jgi:hypothetical protein
MTQAVCYRCGVIKFGAFVPCPDCGAMPDNEDDLALSLAMTDHYIDMPTLRRMGESIQGGVVPHLDPQTHAQLVDQIRSEGLLRQLQSLIGSVKKRGADLPPANSAAKPSGPWWKFW